MCSTEQSAYGRPTFGNRFPRQFAVIFSQISSRFWHRAFCALCARCSCLVWCIQASSLSWLHYVSRRPAIMVHVSALNIYPIKSCKGITLQTANLTYTGERKNATESGEGHNRDSLPRLSPGCMRCADASRVEKARYRAVSYVYGALQMANDHLVRKISLMLRQASSGTGTGWWCVRTAAAS